MSYFIMPNPFVLSNKMYLHQTYKLQHNLKTHLSFSASFCMSIREVFSLKLAAESMAFCASEDNITSAGYSVTVLSVRFHKASFFFALTPKKVTLTLKVLNF